MESHKSFRIRPFHAPCGNRCGELGLGMPDPRKSRPSLNFIEASRIRFCGKYGPQAMASQAKLPVGRIKCGWPERAVSEPMITTARRRKPAWASCPKTQTNSRLARRAVSIVIAPWRAPDLGRVGGDVGDSGSPHAQGKHRPATGYHAPGRRPGSRPGPHLDQNVLARYATVAPASILDPSGGLFLAAARPCQRPAPPLLRKRGTRKSRLETKTENEASSALLARL